MSRLVIIIFLLVLSLLFGYFFAWPKYQGLANLKNEVNNKETELALKEDYIFQLSSISRELEKYQEEVAKINYALPREADVPETLEFLEQACSTNGLALSDITLSPKSSASVSSENPNIKEANISFSVRGKLESFISFLRQVEESAKLFGVNSFSVGLSGGLGGASQGNDFSFKVGMKVRSWSNVLSENNSGASLQPKQVDLNLDILKNPALKELKIFEGVTIAEEKGRENPFIPY